MDIYRRLLDWLRANERAQGLAEYALILVLIAIVAILALTFLGTEITQVLSTVGSALAGS